MLTIMKIVCNVFHFQSLIEAPTGMGRRYLSINALAKTSASILASVPTKILQDQIMKKEGKIIQTFPNSLHSLKSPKDYIQLDKFYEGLTE